MSAKNSATRRASTRVQNQNDETSPKKKVIDKDKDNIQEKENYQLAELIRDRYEFVAGEDREQKDKAWKQIYDECKDNLKHTWTQTRDISILRKTKWPGIKHHAIERYRRGNKMRQDLNTELDKLVLSFIHEVNQNDGKKANENGEEERNSDEEEEEDGSESEGREKQPKMDRKVETTSKSNIMVSGVRTRRTQQQDPSPMVSPINITPPESRQSSQASADSGLTIPGRTRNLKRRASAVDSNQPKMNASTSGGQQEGSSEMSALEKELVQARMQLCEAKVRVNEEEANVNRLEKALWEEMLKKGKVDKAE